MLSYPSPCPLKLIVTMKSQFRKLQYIVVIRFQVKGRNCHWRSVLELMLVLLLDDSLSKQNFRLYAFSRRSYSFRLMMTYEWVFLVVSFPRNNRILPVKDVILSAIIVYVWPFSVALYDFSDILDLMIYWSSQLREKNTPWIYKS